MAEQGILAAERRVLVRCHRIANSLRVMQSAISERWMAAGWMAACIMCACIHEHSTGS